MSWKVAEGTGDWRQVLQSVDRSAAPLVTRRTTTPTVEYLGARDRLVGAGPPRIATRGVDGGGCGTLSRSWYRISSGRSSEQAAEEKNPRECVRLTNLAEILRTTHVRAAVSDAKLKAEIIRRHARPRRSGRRQGTPEVLRCGLPLLEGGPLVSRENLWTTCRQVPETAAQTAAQTAACSVSGHRSAGSIALSAAAATGILSALACLGLDVEQLAALARQGSLHAEGPGSRKRYYRLHFRQAGRQVVRYVGSNPGFVAAVRGELARLPRRTKHSQDLERLVRASRRCLGHETPPVAAAAACGPRLLRREIRRRAAKGESRRNVT